VAAIVLRPGSGIGPHHIQEHCRQNLHNWKCPKEVALVKELPKNTMGKVLNHEVKKLFVQSSPGQG